MMKEKYVFYSVIGEHANQSIEEILGRKPEEIEKAGFSLWGATIDNQSIEQLKKLLPVDTVVVYASRTASGKSSSKDGEIVIANKMLCNGNWEDIPVGIETTFKSIYDKRTNRKRTEYQAYKVKDYEYLGDEYEYDFGGYIRTLSNGDKKTYKASFEGDESKNKKPETRFQNYLGILDEKSNEHCKREVVIKMTLTYPFVVDIKKEYSDEENL